MREVNPRSANACATAPPRGPDPNIATALIRVGEVL
jgi:hypothetical protein